MQLLASLGQYLLLAFVLPGITYLFVFAIIYRDAFELLCSQLPSEPGGESSQGFWLGTVAVIGGLLLSSVTFAIELLLRCLPGFDCLYPQIDFATMSQSGKGVLTAGAAILHFNVGLGLLIILGAYPIYTRCRADEPAPAPVTPKRPLLRDPRFWLATTVIIVALANLAGSSVMFHRTSAILAEAKMYMPRPTTTDQKR